MVLVIKTPLTAAELSPLKEQVNSNTEAISVNTANISVLEEDVNVNTEGIANNTANLATLDVVITELESSLVNTIREVKLVSDVPTITLVSTAENTIIINNSLEEVYGDFSKNIFVNYEVATGKFNLVGSGVITFKLNYLLDKTSGATGEVTVNIYLQRDEVATLVGSKIINVTPAGLSEDLSYNFSYQDGDIVYLTYQTDVANIVLATSGLIPALDLRITQIVGGADLSNYPTKVQADDKYLAKDTFRTLLKTQIGEVIVNVDPAKKDVLLWSDGMFEYGLCNGQGIDATVYPELAAIYGANVPDFKNGAARHLEVGSTRVLGDFQDFATEDFMFSFRVCRAINPDGKTATTLAGTATNMQSYYKSPPDAFVPKADYRADDLPSSVSSTLLYQPEFEYTHHSAHPLFGTVNDYIKADKETRMANIAVQYYVKARVVY